MKKINLPQWAFINSLATLAYVALVATIMQNADKIFGKIENSILGPIAILMLFVFSALVTSSLVMGRPVYLFMDGQKKESIKLLLMTVGWMFTLIVFVFGLIMIIR